MSYVRESHALIAALLLVDSRCAAAATPIDTPRLLAYCEEAQKEGVQLNAFRAGYCFAFVEGVLRGWEAAAFVWEHPVNYCIAASTSLGQLVAAVTKALRDNPATMRGRAEVSVIAAVQKAFPCSTAP
jgi:hypothetical protein